MVLALVVVHSFKILSQSSLTLHTSLGLIISKILRGKSPLSSLLHPCCGDIVALFYKKLDMGSLLVLIQFWFNIYEDAFQNLTYVLRRCISPLNILDIGL